MKRIRIVKSVIGVLLLMGLACTVDPVSDSGGGTDYPNTRTVLGVLAATDRQPVRGARVLLIRSADSLTAQTGSLFIDTAFTDSAGAYRFEGVRAGTYSLEGLSKDSSQIVYLQGIHKQPDSASVLDTLTMSQSARLNGTILVRKDVIVIVEIAGTHYRTEPDSNGVFRFTHLPPGTFEFSILVVDTNINTTVVDTGFTQRIESGTVGAVDTIPLSAFLRWPYAKSLLLNTTISGAFISEDITNFPVLVRLHSGENFDFTIASDNGFDLRFAKENGSELPYEIEHWDRAAGSAAIWVQIDTIRARSKQRFYMYWGLRDAIPVSSSASVFDSAQGYRGVWHLEENGDGTGNAGIYRDATNMGHNGDDFISATGKAGIIGLGQEFDGVDDYILIKPSLEFTSGFVTISSWMKPSYVPADGDVGFRIIGTYADNTDSLKGFLFRSYKNDLLFAAGNGTQATKVAGSWDMLAARWTHVATVWDVVAGVATIYVDGTESSNTVQTSNVLSYANTRTLISHPTRLSAKVSLDEIRVETTARSATWIFLCFENQKERQTLIEY